MASGNASLSGTVHGSTLSTATDHELDHELITILKLGDRVHYTVPSFPVFSVQLVEMKFQFTDELSTTFFDGYIRDTPGLARTYPALIKVCCGYSNAFSIEEDEFDQCISIQNKLLYGGKVFVVWKWTWEDAAAQEQKNTVLDDIITIDSSDDEADNDPECEDAAFESTLVTHTITFKCIGVTKSSRYQEVLAKAAEKFNKGETVEVKLRTEPTNPKESRAIAFDCRVDCDWKTIGYVVKEALDGVHSAIQGDSIISAQFDWIRYLTHWSTSGPGWYCGIRISKRGDWPKEVIRCGSSM